MQLTNLGRTLLIDEECEVLIANTPRLLAECCRLRHQVFCVETGIFKSSGIDQETDDFDDHAHHVLLIHRQSGEAVGTTRVIPSSRQVRTDQFPMTRAFPPGILRTLPSHTMGEISRFAISKQRRSSCGASLMTRLGLMQGIVRLSGELGLTHWCAIMEPKLVRMFQRSGISRNTSCDGGRISGMAISRPGSASRRLCSSRYGAAATVAAVVGAGGPSSGMRGKRETGATEIAEGESVSSTVTTSSAPSRKSSRVRLSKPMLCTSNK